LSLIQFFQILWARRVIVLAALLSCVIAAAVTAELLPERYTGRARVMLDVIKPDPVTGQVLGNQFLRAYTRTQIELIKDYQVAEPVVDRLGWASNPAIIQSYQNSVESQDEDIRHWLAREIIRNTDANLIEASNIMEITFKSSNPDTARRIATVLRDTYVDVSLQLRREAAGKTADWYQAQRDDAQRLVESAEAERAKYAKEHNIVLNAANMDLEQARLDALSAQSASAAALGATPQMRLPSTAGPAQTQLATLEQQIAQAGQTLGPNHPTFQALVRQRAVLQQAAARERAAAGGPVSSGNPAAAINSAYEQQKAKVIARSSEVDRIQQMTRDIEQKRQQLSNIEDRAAQLRLSANVSETGLTPMGSATSGDTPDFPNKPLIMAAATGFGLVLGICLALLVEMLGRRVRTQGDLETSAGAPVLAEVHLEMPEEPRRWLPALPFKRSTPSLPAPEAA
jgi:succinoglycan biosynthesis transport protein ExoP